MFSRPRYVLLCCLVSTLFQTAVLGQVLISQVIEGSSFNKAVVVTNYGQEGQDISGWSLKVFSNVPNAEGTVQHTWGQQSLAAQASLMLCHDRASAYLQSVCDVATPIGFNGNDAIVLLNAQGQRADQVGDTNGATLSGAAWEVACASAATQDNTLSRAPGNRAMAVGDDAWATTKGGAWRVYPVDTHVVADATFDVNSGEATAPPRQPLPGCDGQTPAGGTPAPAPTGPAAPPPPPPPPPSGRYTRMPDEGPLLGTGAGGTCEAPPAQSGDRRREPEGALRLVTYNTEFLFDGIDDTSASRWRGDPQGAQRHARRTAERIAAWDADIVNLVEVEDCGTLGDLVSQLDGLAGASSRYTAYLTQGRDSFTGQDVALITRVDPAEVLTSIEARESFPVPGGMCGFDGEGSTSVSKNAITKWQGLRVGADTLDVALVSLHLKAFPTDPRSCAQREAQATLARIAVEQLAAEGFEVMVAGDINDYSAAIPDAAGSVPTSRVLDILSGAGGGAGPRLRNVMERVPQAERFTAWFDRNRNGRNDGPDGGEATAIDHVLVSPALWEAVRSVTFDTSVPASDDLSDHWPIIVDFGPPRTAAQPLSAAQQARAMAGETDSEAGGVGSLGLAGFLTCALAMFVV